jgi:hypothetical protein
MTTKSDYTEAEWATLLRAPIVAGMAISIADPGGPIETTHEVMATLRAVTAPGSDAELVRSVSEEIAATAKEHDNPVGDFKPKGTMAAQQVLDEVRAANEILTAKAAPDEAAAFRDWLLAVAQAAADAAKEGGFMGFHAERVSAGEKEMLARLASTLGIDAG